jgi:single-strand DNA-binding protein
MPIIHISESGFKQAIISIGTNETYWNEDGIKTTIPMKHVCLGNGKIADIIEKYLVEGMEVAIEGSLKHVPNNSIQIPDTYIQISDLLMLGKRN